MKPTGLHLPLFEEPLTFITHECICEESKDGVWLKLKSCCLAGQLYLSVTFKLRPSHMSEETLPVLFNDLNIFLNIGSSLVEGS